MQPTQGPNPIGTDGSNDLRPG